VGEGERRGMSSTWMTGLEPALGGQVLPVDRYHTGLRLALLGMWFGIVVVLYLAGRALLVLIGVEINAGSILVLVLGAILLTQVIGRWGEKQMLERWPSGRTVHLESGSVTLNEKSSVTRIDLRQKMNYWRWRFVIRGRRGGRVSNGHACVAVRLVQGDTAFSVYAFVPPKQAEALIARYPFYELRGSEDPRREKSQLGGREAVYYSAERARWESGAEVDPADFETLLKHVAAALPEFAMATTS
jgi:hypothetical protein